MSSQMVSVYMYMYVIQKLKLHVHCMLPYGMFTCITCFFCFFLHAHVMQQMYTCMYVPCIYDVHVHVVVHLACRWQNDIILFYSPYSERHASLPSTTRAISLVFASGS